jgi:peptidoglycan-N-acetylglucosamine deacetylase
VRAGRSLRPTSWPGGARCAVALSFDSDHETNELRDGGKSRYCWLRQLPQAGEAAKARRARVFDTVSRQR